MKLFFNFSIFVDISFFHLNKLKIILKYNFMPLNKKKIFKFILYNFINHQFFNIHQQQNFWHQYNLSLFDSFKNLFLNILHTLMVAFIIKTTNYVTFLINILPLFLYFNVNQDTNSIINQMVQLRDRENVYRTSSLTNLDHNVIVYLLLLKFINIFIYLLQEFHFMDFSFFYQLYFFQFLVIFFHFLLLMHKD